MFSVLETHRLRLRPIDLGDIDTLFNKWTQSVTISKFMTWKPHKTREETEKFVTFCVSGWKNNTYTWLIEQKDTGNIIGCFSAEQDRFKVNIGYLLLEREWGKGYMTEINVAFISKAFEIEEIQRVWAVCDVDNISSKRVMEKSGLNYEGLLKSWMIHPNIETKPRDCHCFSIVKGN